MDNPNRNNEIFLKIASLEVTRDQMIRLVFFAFIAGLLIGAYFAGTR